MSIKILIADDHQILRQGIEALLHSQKDMKVIGGVSDGRAAVLMARQLKPDVVVMDISMPDLNGIEATRQVAAIQPETHVIALSMHTHARSASEMLAAGAKGYLIKDGIFEELVEAIRTVMIGKTYLSPRIAEAMANHNGNGHVGSPSVFVRLSPREREVLQLMAEGRATKEIATDLLVSVKTVETHRRQIMEKLNLFSVAELTKYAIGEGITSLKI